VDLSLIWEYRIFAVECALVLVLLGFTCRFEVVERALKRLASHRLAPLVVGASAILLRVALLPVAPVPTPTVHDEFSYLLQADTFAHGRLANPMHLMWRHLETFHVDQVPTYASMYPPLPGLAMALGKVLIGTPFAGVVLAGGLMCGMFCWALRGWFPPGWALLGAGIAVIRIALFSYWGNSYWGGAMTATAGALLLGALARLIRSSRPRDAALAALGIGMLVNARPYEGTIFAVAAGLVALWHIRKLRLRRILPAFCAVLAAAGAFTAYYNWRVFGSPTAMPYTVNRATYAVAPVFIFQGLSPEPFYRHEEMRAFYTIWERGVYERARTLIGYLRLSKEKIVGAWSFYVGPVLTLPLLASLLTWKSRRTRIFLFLAAVVAASCTVTAYFGPHYIAAATVVWYGLMLQGMRALARISPRIVRAIPVVCIVMVGLRLAHPGIAATPIAMNWATMVGVPMDRESPAAELRAKGGQHLVIVHYGLWHNGFAEYVYNDADIDASPIVWARDMGPERNAELIQYFSSRKVWRLDVGTEVVLSPYPGQ